MELPRESTQRLTINGKSIDLPLDVWGKYAFHLFIDGSVTELIRNNRHAMTTRIYRKPDDPLRVYANFDAFQARQLRPISRNRLTT